LASFDFFQNRTFILQRAFTSMRIINVKSMKNALDILTDVLVSISNNYLGVRDDEIYHRRPLPIYLTIFK
jgi:hypothetical protein